MDDMILEVQHLSKAFGSNVVLRDIDFTVRPGDVTSVIGASGSGKSTLLRCINLLETPTSGQILFHGEDITSRKMKESAYRAKVGMVFQSFNLFANLTVLDNCIVGQTKVLKRGKAEARDYLTTLGATQVLGREALATTRPMESARFGGGLDNVGGTMLTSLLAQTAPYGNVASAGLAASAELDMTVMPFIIRGVSLLGVASAGTARDIRGQVWQHLGDDWKPRHLDTICTREVGLDGLPEVFATMLGGGSFGRTLVRID